MGSLPVVLLLCSFHGNAAKQNTQIILFNYGWVAVCLFLCCETLPSCGFCSTALTAVAQTQQAGNALLLTQSHFRSVVLHDICQSVSHCNGSLLRCFLIVLSFLDPRHHSDTWRHLASQWVTADWPLDCLSGGHVNCGNNVFVCFIFSLWLIKKKKSMCCVSSVSADCREEMYPCTRMYSVHRPIKRCIGALCLYRWSTERQRWFGNLPAEWLWMNDGEFSGESGMNTLY